MRSAYPGSVDTSKERKMKMPDRKRQIKSQMKLGAGFALFGLVCPFFWLSFFNGNPGSETWIYGVHSGIFILLGLVLLGKGWYEMKCVGINCNGKIPSLIEKN